MAEVTRIRPPARIPSLGLREVVTGRDVITMLALRDLRLRYRQTMLGVIWVVAGPLLVASLTGDPGLVAGAALVQQLPWLLFALLSGVYVDRLDRRRLIVGVNAARSAVLAGLAVTVATDTVTVPLI